MTKRQICLSVEYDLLEIALCKIKNLSQYVENLLKTEIYNENASDDPQKLIESLKSKNALLLSEIQNLNKEIKKIKSEKNKKEVKENGKIIRTTTY